MNANKLFPVEICSYSFAVVNTCINGKAKTIKLRNHIRKVYAQAAHVPALYPGDEVLFLETEKGVYVLARNLRAEESLPINWQQQDDKLSLKFGESMITISASGEICIRNANANLVMKADGAIELQGKNIQQNSASDIQLHAQNIYLNSEE